LWVGTVAVGLGNFTPDKKPVLPLLFVAAAIPVCFVIGDVRNNRWYRRLAARERKVHEYLAAGASDESFQPFDPSSVNLARRDPKYRWETSFLRNLGDPIPLSIYGAELLFGCIAVTVYAQNDCAIALPVLAILVIVFLAGINSVQD